MCQVLRVFERGYRACEYGEQQFAKVNGSAPRLLKLFDPVLRAIMMFRPRIAQVGGLVDVHQAK